MDSKNLLHQKSFLGFLIVYSLALSVNAEENYKIPNVIVSSTGLEENVDLKVGNILVLEGEELTKKGYSSLEQALERVPGISFVNSGLGRNIDMRGQGSKANVAVKVLVDGREINVLDNSHGVTPLEVINLENIERIEIIPGGGAVLYGNGTRGGVINIITKKSKQDSLGVALKNQFFDAGHWGGSFNTNLSKKINENFAVSADINGFNKDGFQNGSNEKGFFVNSKAYLDFENNSNLVLGYGFFRNKKSSTGYLTKAQVDSNPTQAGADDVLQKITRPEISLDFAHNFSDEWEFNANTFWQSQTIKYIKNIQALKTQNNTSYNLTQSGSSFKDTLTGLKLKNKYHYRDNSYFVVGYDFEHHDAKRDSRVSYGNVGPIVYHKMTTIMDMKKQSHSLFVLDSHQFTEQFSLRGGVRYEYATYRGDRTYRSEMAMRVPPNGTPTDTTTNFSMDKKNTHNFAFELTPKFQYSNTGLIYFKYERGFVSPAPAQFMNRNNTRTNPNLPPYYTANLNSEKYNTFEMGLNDLWWDFYGLNVVAFYTQSKDEISYTGDPHSATGSFWRYYNIDKTRRIGVELALHQNFSNGLTLKQSLNFLDAKVSKGVNDGKRVPYVSKVKATASLEYALNKYFQIFTDWSYYSRAKDGGRILPKDTNTGKISNMGWIKEYLLTDIGASYTYKDWQILGGIHNLFDESYYTYQNSVDNQYLVGSGRNYYLELKYVF
ncbi:TonB-dependent receptor [Helicobacter apodemus]|uniref:TonB-dependent receptor n=1 Tax=Helicobacter apodemus TaxID=135569 RepID=A0A4U8UCC5_9HELI|nr:TonB-dependent receptor [Helicobacter apodemus]TLE14923.1 TonB-dependent receptor [Helicobacter apodemus]